MAATAAADNRQLLSELLDLRQKEPRDDLISVLATAEYTDTDGTTKPLTRTEAMGFVSLLAAAGAETTTKLLGNCMVYLARNPDERRALWDDPELLPSAIEEVLRYDTPSQYQGRVATRDVELHGVTIPEAEGMIAEVDPRGGRNLED